jgi:hypothetical protein
MKKKKKKKIVLFFPPWNRTGPSQCPRTAKRSHKIGPKQAQFWLKKKAVRIQQIVASRG